MVSNTSFGEVHSAVARQKSFLAWFCLSPLYFVRSRQQRCLRTVPAANPRSEHASGFWCKEFGASLPIKAILADLVEQSLIADVQQRGCFLSIPTRLFKCSCDSLHFGFALQIPHE